MYFSDLVKLTSHYLKNLIPKDLITLNSYIEQTEYKFQEKNIISWLDYMQEEYEQSSLQLKSHIPLLSNLLETCLSIDAWYIIKEYEILDNYIYINYLFNIINIIQNIHIDNNIELSEENYHILQQTLFKFSKALLSYLSNKSYDPQFSIQMFEGWLKLKT